MCVDACTRCPVIINYECECDWQGNILCDACVEELE